MAVPVTARVAPAGFKMKSGFRCLIAFSNFPGTYLWEKQVKPPGIDGGGLIDTSDMWSDEYRTADTKDLKTLMEHTFMAGWDPDAYLDFMTMVNQVQGITTILPTLDSLSAWGSVLKFEPGELREGVQPEVTVTIGYTHRNPVSRAIEKPVYTPASGT